ncbi:MAK10-like protein [Tanacetum coccineum]
MGYENPIRTLEDYSKPSHEGYRNTIELPSEDPNQHLKDFLKLVDSLDLDDDNRERTRLRLFQFSLRHQASNWLERHPAGSITTWEDLTTRFHAQFFHREGPRTINQAAGGKLRDRNTKESWALLKDLALYDNKSWNDLRDFSKPIKAITLPQDVPSTFDRRLIELENQVQCLTEAHLSLTQPTQVNKITTLCEICSGPHDTQYCMENPKQAFVEYASSCTDEAGGKWYTFNPEKNNLGDTYNSSWRSHPNLSGFYHNQAHPLAVAEEIKRTLLVAAIKRNAPFVVLANGGDGDGAASMLLRGGGVVWWWCGCGDEGDEIMLVVLWWCCGGAWSGGGDNHGD